MLRLLAGAEYADWLADDYPGVRPTETPSGMHPGKSSGSNSIHSSGNSSRTTRCRTKCQVLGEQGILHLCKRARANVHVLSNTKSIDVCMYVVQSGAG